MHVQQEIWVCFLRLSSYWHFLVLNSKNGTHTVLLKPNCVIKRKLNGKTFHLALSSCMIYITQAIGKLMMNGSLARRICHSDSRTLLPIFQNYMIMTKFVGISKFICLIKKIMMTNGIHKIIET